MGVFGRRGGSITGTARWPRSLTASGERVTREKGEQNQLLANVQKWQALAFRYYDQVPEINYAAQFYSRILSPIELFPGYVNDDGEVERTDNPEAVAQLERVQDPGGGRTRLLSSYGKLRFLVGETQILVTRDPETEAEQWEALSSLELRRMGNTYMRFRAPNLAPENYLEASDDDYEPVDDESAVVYRLWNPHPAFSKMSDCSMRGVLETCEELCTLTQSIRAQGLSRLIQAGILLINDRFLPPDLKPTADDDPMADPILKLMIEAVQAAIKDPGSAAALAPILLRIETEDLDQVMKHVRTVDPSQLFPEFGVRFESIKRLAIGLDMPPEILLGVAEMNHWCTDQETEIFTATGWKRHDALALGEEILTLNHQTGLSEWQPVKDIARFEVQDLPMLSIESRFHSSLTTLNHRWPVHALNTRRGTWTPKWTCSEDLRTTHRLISASPCADIPEEPQYPDALVELVAWLWTEGGISERPGRKNPQVTIYQSSTANLDNVLRIRSALSTLCGARSPVPMWSSRRGPVDPVPRWRETTSGNGMIAFALNRAAAAPLLEHVNSRRIVAPEFIRSLTTAQLALFLETSTRADGHLMPSGTAVLSQSDPERLAAFELAAILAGRTPVRYVQEAEGFTKHIAHGVSVSGRQTHRIKKSHLRQEAYSGTIWCPVTENSSWLARRNGRVFYTGNSAWMVDEHTWRMHGQPIADQFVGDLSSAFYRPTLRKEGVEDWERYCIAYDPAKAINHPDKGKDAQDLFDDGELSGEAYREAKGFGENDAPSEDERNRYLGVKIRDGSLAVYGIPSLRSGGIEPTEGEVETGADTNQPGGSSNEAAKAPPAAPSEAEQKLAALEVEARLARILGACDVALHRARELAGNKLRSRAKRDPEAAKLIDGVPATEVAPTLGRERAATLGAGSERELVTGGRELLAQTLERQGLDRKLAEPLSDRIEQHVARHLWDEVAPPLPQSFGNYVAGLVKS